jgi:amidase
MAYLDDLENIPTGAPTRATSPSSSPLSSWQLLASTKQASILSTVPKQFIHPHLIHSVTDTSSVQGIPETLLSEKELEITSLDAPALISSLASGKLTSVEVLNAFTHRAVIAHQLLNCCLEFPYDSALARAKRLDQIWKEKGGKGLGVLHGLPISVKDQLRVVGTETTCGFVGNLGKKDEQNSLLVDILQDQGAVVFVKTSLSMGCMWGETINKLKPFSKMEWERVTDIVGVQYHWNDE